MKDIEKLKKEFAMKIKCAELSNDFEERFGYEPTVFDCLGMIHIVARCESDSDVSRIMKAVKPDSEFVVNETASGQKKPIVSKYKIQIKKDYGAADDVFSITYFNGGMRYSIEILMSNTDILADYVISDKRSLSSSEMLAYKPVGKGNRLLRELDIPCKRWLHSHISYNGGYLVLTEPWAIDEITERFTKK